MASRVQLALAWTLTFLLSVLDLVFAVGEIVDAINAGGLEHVDVYGIRYRSDPLEGKIGIASDYGRRLIIQRVPPADQILYQTERYNHDDLEYRLSIPNDGEYVLVLKFSEVYFNAASQKVFDVSLNDVHTVVKDLDIFARVGRGTAHDELVSFSVKKGKLKVGDETSDFDGVLNVQMKKGYYDNPKVNALYVMKGKVEDVPPLLPLESPQDDEIPTEEPVEEVPTMKAKHASGPKQPNPYTTQEQSTLLLPIFIAAACFIPAVFCLCKL